MPEMPEVETIRRSLEIAMVGRRITAARTHRADLRRPFPPELAARIKGRRIEALDRRAKYLVVVLDGGLDLLIHLGMSGRILIGKAEGKPGKHEHFSIDLDDGHRVSLFDPRRFGIVDLVPAADLADHPLLRALGPEPLAPAFAGPALAAALKGRNTTIKAALMDQRRVAGLGNIYVCEALYRARLSPKRQASTIADRHGKPAARAEALVDAIKTVLNDAIKAGGSSLRDHRRADGSLGDFQHNFQVYDREGQPCPSCKGKVKRIVQGGRSTFYCPSCQK
jgi:formamidopyrimidine-DNA glycosylase